MPLTIVDSCVQFEVPTGMAIVVSAAGLAPEDKLLLYRRACKAINCPDDGTEEWIPYSPCGCILSIDVNHNPLALRMPGRYKLMFEGATNPDVEVCSDDPIHLDQFPTRLDGCGGCA